MKRHIYIVKEAQDWLRTLTLKQQQEIIFFRPFEDEHFIIDIDSARFDKKEQAPIFKVYSVPKKIKSMTDIPAESLEDCMEFVVVEMDGELGLYENIDYIVLDDDLE
ncbi:MAG: hypothetical protein LIO74_01800 [Ruminococcus sp.]|nr:hypothetical protein [Ruminococcus sp.]